MAKPHMTRDTNENMRFYAIIAAAGQGRRFASTDAPKQYLPVAGKPMLRHSLETFLTHPACAGVRVIIDPKDAKSYHECVSCLNLPPPIEGGGERNISVLNALKATPEISDEQIIFIHDAARPCLNAADIDALLQALQTNRAATLAVPVSATVRRANQSNEAQTPRAGEIVDRNSLWALQTPQAFRKGDLLNAHENAPPGNYTDDTALATALNIEVAIVKGSPENIKITHPEDIAMAEKLLNPAASHITVSGMGFDVHAFCTENPGPVRLCGMDVPHPRALSGHSDADVGLHALTDALLGAIGEGDIGRHFPPSDMTFKDMDSAIFLKHAVDLCRQKHGRIINADLTLICEKPKITPHAESMKARVAEILEIPAARVNVKATTTEKLGFTGREEGIAAQAIVNVLLPSSDGQ